MPRPPRIDFPDAVYHVTSRGNGRAKLFWNDADRERFVTQLKDNVVSAAVLLYAFVLMDNHFHLSVRTPRANLSQFMQRLNTSYALYARYQHRRPGHQFEARFDAKLVQDDTYLLALTRYIHLNPIKIARCRSLTKAERLPLLEGYRWSSYPGYVSRREKLDFVSYDVLDLYSADPRSAGRQYRAYAHACVLDNDRPILDALRASRYAIGDKPFVEATEKRLRARRTGRVQDGDLALPRPTIPLRRIDARVAARFGLDPVDLRQHGHHGGMAKFLAVELACRLTGLTQRAVGLHYGGIGSAAVSVIRRKIREGRYPVGTSLDELLVELSCPSHGIQN